MNNKVVRGLAVVTTVVVLLLALLICSGAVSYFVCLCFGLKWTFRVALGTAAVWLVLYLTIYMAFNGIEGDDDD